MGHLERIPENMVISVRMGRVPVSKRVRFLLCLSLVMTLMQCWLVCAARESGELVRKAQALLAEGKTEEALKAAGVALADAERRHGGESLELSEPLEILADVHQSRKSFKEAAEVLERLRRIQESNLGPRSTRVSSTISDLIALYEKMGDAESAAGLNEIAYERWSKPRVVRTPISALPEQASVPAKPHSLKDIESYAKIMMILADYRKKHTYSTEDFFVCADMVVDIWNILKTQGIPSKISVGNVEKDIRLGGSEFDIIAKMNHAWILAEVKPGEWIPLEATGGFIVDPSAPNHDLYLRGFTFDSPRQFKDFSDMRMSFYKTCKEANKLVENYNSQYAGKTASHESLEQRGRALQKHEDCKSLANGVIAYLKR